MAESKVPLSRESYEFFVKQTARVAQKSIADETLGTELETTSEAKKQVSRAPLWLMTRMRVVEGDNLNTFPRSGTTANDVKGNAMYDKFKVKRGERTLTSSFYDLMAEDYPYGQDARMHLDIIAQVNELKDSAKIVPNPYKDDPSRRNLFDVYKNMRPSDRDEATSLYKSHISAMAGALRKAVELHHKLSAINNLDNVRARVRMKDGSKTELSATTYPIFVCKKDDPDDYQNYTVGAFLRLDPESLPADATFDQLKATAKRETGEDEDEDHAGHVKSLETFTKTTTSYADFINSDTGWALVKKHLNAKDQRVSDPFAYNLYLIYSRLAHYMEKEGGLERGERVENELSAPEEAAEG